MYNAYNSTYADESNLLADQMIVGTWKESTSPYIG